MKYILFAPLFLFMLSAFAEQPQSNPRIWDLYEALTHHSPVREEGSVSKVRVLNVQCFISTSEDIFCELANYPDGAGRNVEGKDAESIYYGMLSMGVPIRPSYSVSSTVSTHSIDCKKVIVDRSTIRYSCRYGFRSAE